MKGKEFYYPPNRMFSEYSEKIKDCLLLFKANLVLMVVLTTALGYFVAVEGKVDFFILLNLAVGVFGAGAGAHAFNQALEKNADSLMNRTKNRPVPSGRITQKEAFFLGTILITVSVTYLSLLVSWQSGALALLTFISYVWVYTPLKKISILNTWAGSISGSLPPIIGWSAVENIFQLKAGLLFAILFIWQIPHFLALSWKYKEEYEKGGFKMLPLIDKNGRRITGLIAFVHTAMLLGVTTGYYFAGGVGFLYLLISVLAGSVFLYFSALFWKSPNQQSALKVFWSSIVYLPVLMLALILGHIDLI